MKVADVIVERSATKAMNVALYFNQRAQIINICVVLEIYPLFW